MLKLLVTDMDGTLLNEDKEISKSNLESLLAFQEAGGKVALASGRNHYRLAKYAELLKLDKYGGLLLEANGASIYDYKDNSHDVVARITSDEAEYLLNYLKPFNQEIIIMGERDAFVIPYETDYSKWIANSGDESKDGRNIYLIKDLSEVDQEINKICIYNEDAAIIDKLNDELNNLDHNYWHGIVHPTWLEITPIRLSKGNALLRVMDKYNLDKDEVIVFGDSDNDISMLKEVKYSVAMSNALDRVKEVCYSITKDNNNDGVSYYLDKILKEES